MNKPLSAAQLCAQSLDESAKQLAKHHGLVDADNWLHCWACKQICDWHISLHCEDCLVVCRERIALKKQADAEAWKKKTVKPEEPGLDEPWQEK